MASAPVGDDVFGEDPTVNRLQDVAAERMGKEAALFVPSGTMANLIGVLVNAHLGQEVIADADSHIFMAEAAGAAVVGGVQLRPLATDRGIMSPAQIDGLVRPSEDAHQPTTAAIVVEDTHNRHGGVAWPIEDLLLLRQRAQSHGLAVHVDGARIFNAAIATGVDVKLIAHAGDTMSFCLSKGLSCPAGSLFCGPKATIPEAKRWRKMLGGGLRQAGVLAAAGLVALETMVDRLPDDHMNARTLAEGLAEMSGVECDLSRVETNIVFIRLTGMPQAQFLAECRTWGLLAAGPPPDRVRLVTHRGISAPDIQDALRVCAHVLGG
jgi:threonine aldolase